MKRRSGRVICLLAISMVGLIGSAWAVPLPFEDGFENTAVGAYPNANGWLTLRTGSSGYVSNGAAFTGSHSFRLDSRPFSARIEYLRLEDVPDRLSYQASVLVDSAYGRDAVVGFMKSYFGEVPAWDYFHVDARSGRVEFYGVNQWVLGAYVPGTWCTVRADLDFSAAKADLWLNGALVVAEVAITPKVSYQYPLGEVVLNQWAVGCPSNNDFTAPYLGNVVYFDDIELWEPSAVIAVTVDVKPGANPNFVNPRARGLLPLAIFSSDGFDATQIDPSTVAVAGAGVALRGNGSRYMAHFEDLNGDGLLDLIVQVTIQELDLEQLQDGCAMVTGSTFGGDQFEGSDEVRLVPPK